MWDGDYDKRWYDLFVKYKHGYAISGGGECLDWDLWRSSPEAAATKPSNATCILFRNVATADGPQTTVNAVIAYYNTVNSKLVHDRAKFATNWYNQTREAITEYMYNMLFFATFFGINKNFL